MSVQNIKMLYYDIIDISEGINAHQKSVMFVAIDFLNYIFKFQPNVSNRYHDLVMMSVNLSDMSILLFQTLKVLIIIVLLV